MTPPAAARPGPHSALAPIAERANPPERLERPGPVPTPIGELTWRTLTAADVDGLFALVQEIEEAEASPRRTLRADLLEMLCEPAEDLARDTIAAVDAVGQIRAYGTLMSPSGDTTISRVFVTGGVQPRVRGNGIGSVAVEWLVGRARQKLAEIGREVPARIVTFMGEDALDQEELFASHGFRAIRFYTAMRRDLSEPIPLAPLDADLRVVAWSAELDESIRLAHNDAFQDHWGSQPRSAQSWVRGRARFAPTWSFAVLDTAGTAADSESGAQTDVVGYIMSSRNEVNWAATGIRSGFSELLGVRREYRGRKIAKALLVAVMSAYRADGMECAELDVDTANPSGAHDFYVRLGYVPYGMERMFSIEL